MILRYLGAAQVISSREHMASGTAWPVVRDQRNSWPRSPSARRILLLNMYGEPSLAASAQYLGDLAHYLAAKGWIVEILCSNRLYEDATAKLPARDLYGRVTLRRLPLLFFATSGLLRLLGYVEFLVRALFYALFGRRPAVCVTMTTPPFLLAIGAIMRLRRARHLHWSLDVYPELAHALGAIGGRTTSLLARARRILWHMTDLVVTLGPRMGETLAGAGLPRRKVRVIPLWAKADEFPNRPVATLPPEVRFTLLYSGNIGKAHDVDTAFEAARRLPNVAFVFAGRGMKRRQLELAARDLPNVSLRPLVQREQMGESLCAASAHLVTLDPRADGLLIPSKLYGAMASGRPVVVVASRHNDLAAEMEHGGFGFLIEPGDIDGFCAAVRRLVENRDLAAEAGRCAREAFLAQHESSKCMKRFHKMARALAGGAGL